ncbi:MAG: hypothetical protein LAP61_26090 [Acidobacteriia bacterium]|nr:hypothetical protein [Terriglobia bacterium]
MRRAVFVVIFGLIGTCLQDRLQAQWIDHKAPGIPRTADGKPDLKAAAPKTQDAKADLSGLWLLAPGAGGLSQLKPAEIPAPATALYKQREENLGSDSPGTQCLPFGFITAGGAMVKIVQTPGLIVMLTEDLEYRQIFLDGRELPKDPNPAWMGYSVGHWDGDTLVVESTGYNDRTWLDNGYPHSESLHLTERIRRSDFGHLIIEATWSDPKIYPTPWTSKVQGVIAPDTELLEYVCAENEKDRVHLVGKNSDDTKNAVKLSADVLSKYVGGYEVNAKDFGIPGVEKLLLQVALEDGVLKFGMGDGPKQPMTPISETIFTGFGGRVEFGKDDKGEVTHLTIRAAEGDFRANRKN